MGGIVIADLITTIARCLGVEPNSEDRVSAADWLDKDAFEQMKSHKVKVGRLSWIYPRSRLLPLGSPYFTRITFHGYLVMLLLSFLQLLNPSVLSMMALVHPPSLLLWLWGSSSHPEEQASLRTYVETEHAAICDFIQKWCDELCGMMASQDQYF